MKRLLVFLLTVVLIFSSAGCSTIQNSDIENSQEVGSSSTEPKTENVEADIIDETEIAQQAYDLIENAEDLCKAGMGIISAAWHFGIWNASECDASTVMEQLSAQIGFDVSFVEENGGYTADELVNGDGNWDGWEFCLMTAENCLSAVGVYTSVGDALDSARDLIRKIPADYEHYQNLKDYYTKVAAYVAYFENISGSYNDLTEAIAKYEGDIQVVKEPLLFDFD
ncbi:MAG: hypothetical protein NC251_12535 [Lachnoclostridium sp.]|nr:hypothetical protein [Lachnospira sp.]MCM1249241.1 hypothetical protein [Lachnoclostridium sp.]